jgi:TPR repeat protein
MWLSWLPLALAAEPPLLDTLARALVQDGAALPGDALRARVERACVEGRALACAWARDPRLLVTRPDPDALSDLLRDACARGERDACVAEAWTLGQVDGAFSANAVEAGWAYDALVSACAAGIPRACTDAARMQHDGVGTYPSPQLAAVAFEASCAGGEPRACRELAPMSDLANPAWVRAAEAGDPDAAWRLAAHRDDRPALGALCDQGVPAACDALAQRGDDAVARLRQACDLGDRRSCARALVLLDNPPAQRATALRRLDLPIASLWAQWLEMGAPVDPFATEGSLPPIPEKALWRDVREQLNLCYLDDLASLDPDEDAPSGWLDVTVALDAQGVVTGASTNADWWTAADARCAMAAARDARPVTEAPRAMLLTRSIGLDHEAKLTVRRVGFDDYDRSIDLEPVLQKSWAKPLDECALRIPTDQIHDGAIRVWARRDGTIKKTELLRSVGDASADACMLGRIATLTVPENTAGISFDLNVLPLQWLEPPRDEPPPYRTEPYDFAGVPAPFRVLTLIVNDGRIAGEEARLTEKSVASIRADADTAWAWVEEHAGGAVDVVHTIRQVEHPLLHELGAREDPLRWHAAKPDLSPEMFASVEPNTWDLVMVWVPLPRGAPQTTRGVAWGGDTFQGASFITAALASGRELTASEASPRGDTHLQAFYLAVQGRATRALGVNLPSETRPIRLSDGKFLGPGRKWYAHVFHNHLHPTIWSDLAAKRQGLGPRPGNLLAGGEAIAPDDVFDPTLILDGLTTMPGYADSARPHAPDAKTWYGAALPKPSPVARVVVELDQPAPARVEVMVDGRWRAVAQADEAAARHEIRFAPAPAEAVRVVVAAGCRELEAYAD